MVVEEQSGKEAGVEVGDGEEVAKCRKKEAVVETADAVEPGREKGGDVDRRVVGTRGNIEQRQPFGNGIYVYYDVVVAKVK